MEAMTIDQDQDHKSDDEKNNENDVHLAEYDRLMGVGPSTENSLEDDRTFYSTQISNHLDTESPSHHTYLMDFHPGVNY